jgi:hypothetical protein
MFSSVETVDNLSESSGWTMLRIFLSKTLFVNGMTVEPCAPYKHGQNGVVERNGRTVKEHANAMLLDSALPENFWEECMKTFAYCWNRFPMSKTGSVSPYEAFYDKAPWPCPLLPLRCLMVTLLPTFKKVSGGLDYNKSSSVTPPVDTRSVLMFTTLRPEGSLSVFTWTASLSHVVFHCEKLIDFTL